MPNRLLAIVFDAKACASEEYLGQQNEFKSHDAFKHVGIQLLKFVTSVVY